MVMPRAFCGGSASVGALSYMSTASTPGAASAWLRSIRVIRPAAIVDETSAACTWPGRSKSDG